MTPREALQVIINTLDHVDIPSGPVGPNLRLLKYLKAIYTLDPDMLGETVTLLPEDLGREFIVLG